jgi:hypothetical protein
MRHSHPVIVDLQTIFETQRIINNLIEMTLGGNLALVDLKRLECQTDDKETSSGNFSVCISTKKLVYFFFRKAIFARYNYHPHPHRTLQEAEQ